MTTFISPILRPSPFEHTFRWQRMPSGRRPERRIDPRWWRRRRGDPSEPQRARCALRRGPLSTSLPAPTAPAAACGSPVHRPSVASRSNCNVANLNRARRGTPQQLGRPSTDVEKPLPNKNTRPGAFFAHRRRSCAPRLRSHHPQSPPRRYDRRLLRVFYLAALSG